MMSTTVARKPRAVPRGDSDQTPEPPHPNPLPFREREFAPFGERVPDTSLGTAALYRLMAWLSPAYPVGAFSYSGGLEWAVEAGDVTDAAALAAWLAMIIGEGGGFCDAVLFAHAHCAAAARDEETLHSV